MGDDEEYEIMPHKDIIELKKELKRLKDEPSTPSKGMQASVEKLSDNIGNMMDLFREATKEMTLEEQEDKSVSKKIEPLMEKVDILIEQNEKIAQGIVAVADMIKDLKENHPAVSQESANDSSDDFSFQRPAPSSPPPVQRQMPPREMPDAFPPVPPIPRRQENQGGFGQQQNMGQGMPQPMNQGYDLPPMGGGYGQDNSYGQDDGYGQDMGQGQEIPDMPGGSPMPPPPMPGGNVPEPTSLVGSNKKTGGLFGRFKK